MEEKLATIRLFMKFVSFRELVESYRVTEKREYVLQALPDALFVVLASFIPEAAEFYTEDRQCQEHARMRGRPTIDRFIEKAEEIAEKFTEKV
jgi:leucyl-tRNA synthetase